MCTVVWCKKGHEFEHKKDGSIMGLMNEYIEKRMSGKQLEEELLKYIGLYNKKRDTCLIVYASAISKQVPGNTLNMEDYYTLFDMLRNIDSKNIDKILTCSVYNHTILHSYLTKAETGNIA